MGHTISVIVPVYNVSNYLRQCVESISRQTYVDLEIILVDDGSTDESGVLCDQLANEDQRVKVVHQKNSGSASAKNVALRLASGEYLAFADSDDIVEVHAYEHLFNALNCSGADVVQGSFLKLFTDSEELKIQKPLEENTEQFLGRFTTDWTCGLLWDKLYRRKLFDGIFFEEGNVIDDEFFTYRGIMNAEKIVRIPDVVYKYRQRKSSVMASHETKHKIVLDKIHYLQLRRKNIADRFPPLACTFDEHYLNMLIILSHDANASKESIIETKQAIKSYFKDKPAYNPPVSLRLKLAYLQYARVKEILSNRDKEITDFQENRYFS